MTAEEEAPHLAAAEVELRHEFPHVPAYAVREAIEIERKAFDRATIRDSCPSWSPGWSGSGCGTA